MKSDFCLRGYIALVSALIIAAILSALALASSTDIFFARFNELDYENKLVSLDLAYSCAYEGLYESAENSIPTYHKKISVAPIQSNIGETCSIDSISSSGNTLTIYTHAAVDASYTDIKVTAVRSDTSDETISIQSWQEVSDIPP